MNVFCFSATSRLVKFVRRDIDKRSHMSVISTGSWNHNSLYYEDRQFSSLYRVYALWPTIKYYGKVYQGESYFPYRCIYYYLSVYQ